MKTFLQAAWFAFTIWQRWHPLFCRSAHVCGSHYRHIALPVAWDIARGLYDLDEVLEADHG